MLNVNSVTLGSLIRGTNRIWIASFCHLTIIMLDVPPHLFHPLCVNTNISYALDMSKFPGLDDPQQMYQPALLIATDWSDYVFEDTHHVSDEGHDVVEDDLFALIESCHDLLPDIDFSAMDPVSFENLIDDVITDATVTTSEDFEIANMSNEIIETTPSVMDTDELKESRVEGELSPLQTGARGRKRRRDSDTENQHYKNFNMVDDTSLRLPSLVSVCPRSNVCAMHRGS